MLSEELHELIDRILKQKCEMQNIELKKAEKGTPEKLYDSLSSFSNQSGGGTIIFGKVQQCQGKSFCNTSAFFHQITCQ